MADDQALQEVAEPMDRQWYGAEERERRMVTLTVMFRTALVASFLALSLRLAGGEIPLSRDLAEVAREIQTEDLRRIVAEKVALTGVADGNVASAAAAFLFDLRIDSLTIWVLVNTQYGLAEFENRRHDIREAGVLVRGILALALPENKLPGDEAGQVHRIVRLTRILAASLTQKFAEPTGRKAYTKSGIKLWLMPMLERYLETYKDNKKAKLPVEAAILAIEELFQQQQ
jgi:hypothetical protein